MTLHSHLLLVSRRTLPRAHPRTLAGHVSGRGECMLAFDEPTVLAQPGCGSSQWDSQRTLNNRDDPIKTLFYHRLNHLGRPEDSWFLVEEPDGARYVEHEWSHFSPYVDRRAREGAERHSPDEFLADDHDETAKARLARLLAKRRRRGKPRR
jgi:hypothetical protein